MLQNLQSINLDENGVAEIEEEENRKVEEENKGYLRKSNASKFHAKLSESKRCTYEQQMTIACDISVDNSQTSFEHSDQNNNVDSSISDKYYEDMEIDKRILTTIGNVGLQEKVGSLFSGGYFTNNTTSNTTPSPDELDRSSINDLSWDNNTLDLNDNDIELDYNPPRRTRSFNGKRSSSVPTRLGTLREDPDNSQKNYNLNESFVKPTIKVTYPEAEHDISSELDISYDTPGYNLNKSKVFSIVRDPNGNIIKFGMFCI